MDRLNFKDLNTKTDVKLSDSAIKNIGEVMVWVNNNITGQYLFGACYATFYLEDDAFVFRLMWG